MEEGKGGRRGSREGGMEEGEEGRKGSEEEKEGGRADRRGRAHSFRVQPIWEWKPW